MVPAIERKTREQYEQEYWERVEMGEAEREQFLLTAIEQVLLDEVTPTRDHRGDYHLVGTADAAAAALKLVRETAPHYLYPKCRASAMGGPGHQSRHRCAAMGPHAAHHDHEGNDWVGGMPGEPDVFLEYWG